MPGIIIVIGFVVAGILTGSYVFIPYSYSQYIAVAILACLDSVFGALYANMEKKFRMNIFLTGFFGNSLIAIFLVFIGKKLNVDIYLAAVIVFSGRLLNNFTAIRRVVIDRIEKKQTKIQIEGKNKREKKVRKNLKEHTKQVDKGNEVQLDESGDVIEK